MFHVSTLNLQHTVTLFSHKTDNVFFVLLLDKKMSKLNNKSQILASSVF